eukprot:5794434-Amphidinium_carterae.1
MKAYRTVDRGIAMMIGGGNQVLANQGQAARGPLDPDATWTSWANFANKVYHFWRLVGPQLWESRQRASSQVTSRGPC